MTRIQDQTTRIVDATAALVLETFNRMQYLDWSVRQIAVHSGIQLQEHKEGCAKQELMDAVVALNKTLNSVSAKVNDRQNSIKNVINMDAKLNKTNDICDALKDSLDTKLLKTAAWGLVAHRENGRFYFKDPLDPHEIQPRTKSDALF
jgi:hypothetical protein